MNSVIIHGRLSRDPELKVVEIKGDDVKVCNFSVAVDKYGEGANFFRCQAWRKSAEMVDKHFHKGKEIIVQGSMEQDKYEKDGETRYSWTLNAQRIEFCGKKDDAPAGTKSETSSQTAPESEDDDDVPF